MNASNKVLLGSSGLSVERDGLILRDVDWTVRKGEHWVILGANGSGKSTLLNVFNAFMAPTTGRLFAFGREGSLADEVVDVADLLEQQREEGEAEHGCEENVHDLGL